MMIDAQEEAVVHHALPMPCRAASASVVIREQGDVVACELAELAMGNLRDFGYDLARLWRSAPAAKVRRWVESGRCICGHECNLATDMVLHVPSLLRLVKAMCLG